MLCSSETKVSRTQIGYHFVNGGVYVPMIYDHMTPISVQEEFTSFKLPLHAEPLLQPHPGPVSPLLHNWEFAGGEARLWGGGRREILGMCLYFPGRRTARQWLGFELFLSSRPIVKGTFGIFIITNNWTAKRGCARFGGNGPWGGGGGGRRCCSSETRAGCEFRVSNMEGMALQENTSALPFFAPFPRIAWLSFLFPRAPSSRSPFPLAPSPDFMYLFLKDL